MGYPRDSGGAQGDHTPARHPAGDGEADAGRTHPPRCHPYRRGRQTILRPQGRGREGVAILRAQGEKESEVLRAEGEAAAYRNVQSAQIEMAGKLFERLGASDLSPEALRYLYLKT